MTWYQLQRSMVTIWDNLMYGGRGSVDQTVFRGLEFSVYSGFDLIGIGSVDEVRGTSSPS